MFRENELRNTQCWYFIVKKKKNNNIHTQKEIKEKTKINPKGNVFKAITWDATFIRPVVWQKAETLCYYPQQERDCFSIPD